MKSVNSEMTNERAPIENSLRFFQSLEGSLLIQLKGDWKIGTQLPSVKEVEKQLTAEAHVERVGFDTSGLTAWDSGLLTFVIKIRDLSTVKKIQFNSEGLPEGARRLLRLASAVPERKGARKEFTREFILSLMGGKAIDFFRSASEMIAFIGEATITFAKFLVGKATFRRSDCFSCSRNVVPRPFPSFP